MLAAFVNSFKIPELRTRILFTIGLIFLCRILSTVPTPGADPTAMADLIQQQANQSGGGVMVLLNLFAGGAMSNLAVGYLGIMPYISASIIIQLMTAIIPQLERLSREGDVGRAKISQYTRYLTLIICVIQAFFWARGLEMMGSADRPIVLHPEGISFELISVLTMTTATMMLMWLGEQITDRGVGNGISLIITINIIASLPMAVTTAVQMYRVEEFGPFHIATLAFMMFFVTAATVAITQAVRKIPVQHAKRIVGNKVYKGGQNHIPLRVNYSGVMPIIFAEALMIIPTGLIPWVLGPERSVGFSTFFTMGGGPYMVCYTLMILFFSYFWVATQFHPVQMADDLKRSGAYVPGIRPGKPTAEFLNKTMVRITFVGALAITAIAVIPRLLASKFGVPYIIASFFGGTSLLIMVGVALDTMRQVESHLVMRYPDGDGFFKKGRSRGRH